jgi:hypothetical protein
MTTCPVCAAPLKYDPSRHVKDCQAIEIGLLALSIQQTTPPVPQDWRLY